MNLNRYSCNVVIAGLATQLSSPEGIPSVSFWGTRELELEFIYGSGAVRFHRINNPSLQTKKLGIAEKGWNSFFFAKGEGFLQVYLI